MSSWLFLPVMVLATMLAGIVAALAARAHPRTRVTAAVVACSSFAIPVFLLLHEVLSGVKGDEEPVTFVIALLVAPAAFAVAASFEARDLSDEHRDRLLAGGFLLSGAGVATMVLELTVTFTVGAMGQGLPTLADVEAVVGPLIGLATAAGAAMAAFALARENSLVA